VQRIAQRKASRLIVTVVLTVLMLFTSFGLAAPESAMAYPSQCGYSFVANGGAAWCSGGYGQVRVVLGCKNIFGWWTNVYGPWVGVGQGASRTGCPFGYGVQWVGLGGLR
jgi:hypothetical protein